MLFHTFKSACRWLMKNSLFTAINVLGLAISLCAAFFIFLWFNKELSMDSFHEKKDQVFFVSLNYKLQDGKLEPSTHTSALLAPFLAERFPQIQEYSRLRPSWEKTFVKYQQQEQRFKGFHAEEGFLHMFSFPLLQGDIQEALASPDKIVLTEKVSKALFGEADPIGASVEIKDAYSKRAFTVSAVLKNVPEHSSMQFDYLLPYQEFENRNEWVKHWGNGSLNTFIELKPGINLEEFENQISKELESVGNFSLQLTPLSNVYLGWPLDIPIEGINQGSLGYLKIFAGVGIFILLIAGINYINLSTAQNFRRSKEAGIKKVLGSDKRHLFQQSITEFVLVFSLAALLAVTTLILLLPFIQAYWQISFSLQTLSPTLVSGFLIILLLIFGCAGIYLSLQHAGSLNFAVLKARGSQHATIGLQHKVLVIFQFVLASLFIVSSITLYKQLKFIREVNIGVDRENVIYFETTEALQKHFGPFKEKLLVQPGIQNITQVSDLPFEVGMTTSDPWWPGKQEDDRTWFKLMQVDYGFPATFEVKLKEGRWFSPDFNDTSNYVINETTARHMGIENPLGTKFRCWGEEGQVVGIVEDFHQNSLHSGIEPMVFRFDPENAEVFCLRTEPGQTAMAIDRLKTVYQEIESSYPLDYHFLDARYEGLYKREQLMAVFANTFSVLAIFISCMGIFGLSVLSAHNRRKEVGIRKVNGARVWQVMLLLNKEFLQWVLLAFIISCPIAWYIMNEWLQNFAYRTDLSWWIFASAGLAALIVAIITVSWQSWRAASRNPVKALGYE
jgi:putative ABC transport system permease protein